MYKKLKATPILLIILVLLTSACKASISRNDDGSVTLETSITAQELQEVLDSSIADPLVQELTVSLQTGYVSVIGTRQRLNDASKTDTLSFRLDLSVSNGNLVASVSDWNQTIANRLSNFGGANQNATLESVNITPQIITLVWNVERE
jgi:hypothetical protein